MDDLEVNPLYRAFLSEFKSDFENACQMSYIVAIPHSDCLEELQIDQTLANHHILVPSRLLKSHFCPLQDDYIEDIELENGKLICTPAKSQLGATSEIKVNILGEVIGYSQHHTRYKVIMIDKALIGASNLSLAKSFLVSRFSPIVGTRLLGNRARLKPPRPLLDHDSCAEFLESISQSVTMELELNVKQLQSRYLILSEYLDDAAARIRRLADRFVPRYEAIIQPANGVHRELTRRDIRLSVENYIVYLLHGKLMASIQNWQAKNDRRLLERFQQIYSSKITICQLGAQEAFADFDLSDELALELVRLPSLQSPLAMASSLVKAVDMINEGLNQCVKLKSLTGEAGLSDGDKVFICSDDLIATFVYSLAQVRPPSLYSLSKYLETFGWSSSSRDRPAYYMATFQLVIQYVFGYDPESEVELQSTSKNRSDLLPASPKPSIPAATRSSHLLDSADSARSTSASSSSCSSPENESFELDLDAA